MASPTRRARLIVDLRETAERHTGPVIASFLDLATAVLVNKGWRQGVVLRTTRITLNKKAEDSTVESIASSYPNLTSIDLRACSNITDAAVTAIATHCPNLTSINLRRAEPDRVERGPQPPFRERHCHEDL